MSYPKEVQFNKDGKKWLVVKIGLLLSVMTLLPGVYDGDNWRFPPEKYISAAAFVMLIATAILQNVSLDKQQQEIMLNRQSLNKQVQALEQQIEEVKLNRKSLEIQAGEMKNHTTAFEESNNKTEESLKQQQFYEILKLKEQLYLEIIKEVSEKDGYNKIQRFNSIVMKALGDVSLTIIEANYRDRFFEAGVDTDNFDKEQFFKIYNFVEDDVKNDIRESINKNMKTLLVRGSYDELLERSMIKLHSYHLLIENLVDEDQGIAGSLYSMRDQVLSELKPIPDDILYGRKKEDSPKIIYSFLLSEDESILYKIIENKISFRDIF